MKASTTAQRKASGRSGPWLMPRRLAHAPPHVTGVHLGHALVKTLLDEIHLLLGSPLPGSSKSRHFCQGGLDGRPLIHISRSPILPSKKLGWVLKRSCHVPFRALEVSREIELFLTDPSVSCRVSRKARPTRPTLVQTTAFPKADPFFEGQELGGHGPRASMGLEEFYLHSGSFSSF